MSHVRRTSLARNIRPRVCVGDGFVREYCTQEWIGWSVRYLDDGVQPLLVGSLANVHGIPVPVGLWYMEWENGC